MGRGATGWPHRISDRLKFERGARAAYPILRGGPTKRTTGFRYFATVEVPYYEPRAVTIIFFPAKHLTPTVFADGPHESPHRYDDGSLCMWHPDDSPSMRWRFDHGLLDLLDAIQAHLFREGWWREHGEWLGPEVAHRPNPGQKESV